MARSQSGNEVTDCSARDCGGHGIVNSGEGTSITDSTFLGNAIDVAGGGGTLDGNLDSNDFETGGPEQARQYYDDD